jgi:putative transposase
MLLAWVIMPEHIHLLVLPNHEVADVPMILWGLKKPFAQRVISRWRELGAPILHRLERPDGSARFWQGGGGYDRNIVSTAEYLEKRCYIHENPVHRGLCNDALDWPWSSATWYSDQRERSLLQIDPFDPF